MGGEADRTAGVAALQFEFSQDLGSRLPSGRWTIASRSCASTIRTTTCALKAEQQAKLVSAFDAARKVGREILIEIIASKSGPLDDDTISRALAELYDAGLRPDWWKLEPQASVAAWRAIDAVIAARDPYCRGVVLLGLEAPVETLTGELRRRADCQKVRGFAVGRTIFAETAGRWLNGRIGDDQAVDEMAAKFAALVDLWLSTKSSGRPGQ